MTLSKFNKTIIAVLLIWLTMLNTSLFADSHLDPRVQIGLNLFPAVIAANKRLNNQTKDRPLTIYIIYSNNEHLALKSGKQLEKIRNIRGYRLIIKPIRFKELSGKSLKNNDALFLLEKNKLNLSDVINYAQNQKVILFSPFTGDVEKGVMSGFKVSNKVLPAINLKSMKASNIYLKAFFLRIAVKYD